jgi:penicillin-binding protein 1A
MSRRERQRRRRRRHHGPARPLFLGLGVVAGAIGLAVIGAVAWIIGIAATAPPIKSLKPIPQGATSIVYAADGQRLGYVQSTILRSPVASQFLPQTLKDATVAIEDKRFYQHKGVDFEGIIRAALKNFESHQTVQGGSTLTMQLVKNLYEKRAARSGPGRTFKTKIREAKLAEDLENVHTGRQGKLWILTKYLNDVPYGTVGGQTAVGAQAAARIFFDKPAAQLTLPEAALLAGLPQAPSRYNPFLNPQAALDRRNQVLENMAQQGYIQPDTAAAAERAPLGVRHNRYYTERREGYFFDYVLQQLVSRYGFETVRRGGLRIYTTLDLRLQQAARRAMAQGIAGTDRDSALVSIDPNTGYIRAMATSRKYGDLKFNLAAQGHRQPGSTFKVMVLMTALRRGVDPNATTYTSMPLKFTDPEWGPIDVKTYSNSYIGRANLVKATLVSDNSIYEQLDLDLGPQNVKQTAYDMGITTHLNGYPAEGLGGLRLGVSPLEMARAYSTIANGGQRIDPIAVTKVTFPDGHSEVPFPQHKVRVFSDGVAYEATKILHDNILEGTGTRADFGCPAAGKTGTTDDFTDAWFVGYTPRLTTAVWVGHANSREPMPGAAGGVAAAPIWGAYMKAVHGSFCGDFPQPKTPFQAVPFFGRYSRTGIQGNQAGSGYTYGTQGTQQLETGGTSAGGTKAKPKGKHGGKGYDPTLYESPPQKAPKTAPTPPTPTPTPTQPTPPPGATTGAGGGTGATPGTGTPGQR